MAYVPYLLGEVVADKHGNLFRREDGRKATWEPGKFEPMEAPAGSGPGGPADWDELTNLPAVIAAGADAAEARTAISAAPSQGSSFYRRSRTVAASNGTDDTAAVQAVFAEGPGEIVFPKGGTWIIDCNPTTGMLKPQSNTRVIIEEGATVKVKTNALPLYNLFKMDGVSNVKIEGAGTLLGDSATHTGTTGHYGHLILISNGSSNCRVVGPLLLKQAWGDGINMGGTAVSYDVLVDGVIVEDCRRQGMGPTWVDGCTIQNSRFFNISQTAYDPVGCTGMGIDIEPNADQFVDHMTVDNCDFNNTAGGGIGCFGHFGPVSNVRIRNNNIVNCSSNSGATAWAPQGLRVKMVDNAQLIDNTVIGSGWAGATSVNNLALTQVTGAMVRGGYYAGANGAGIWVDSSTYVNISGAVVHNNLRRGILVNASDDTTIRGNDFIDNCQDNDASTAHVHVLGASSRVAIKGNTFRGTKGGRWVTVLSPAADCAVEDNVALGPAPVGMLADTGTNTRQSMNSHVDSGVNECWDLTGSTPMGKIDLGHATDTTISRVSAGKIAVEGVNVPTISSTDVFTNKTLTAPVLGGASVLPQSGTLELHNQADRTTNYERARHFWSSDIYTIQTEVGGTGTARQISVSAGSAGSIAVFGGTQSPTVGTVRLRASLSAANGTIAGVNGTLSAASGVQYGLSVAPTHTQTSTAGYTALLVNSTETTTGSGAKKLIDAQVAGTSKFAVDNTGVVTATASAAAGTAVVRAAVPATASSTGVAGQIAWDTGFLYTCTATNTWVRSAHATW